MLLPNAEYVPRSSLSGQVGRFATKSKKKGDTDTDEDED